MPKGRRNSIATSGNGSSGMTGSGSGGNTGVTAETIINQRLVDAGTITVQVDSRTRRSTEDVQVRFTEENGIAEVSSASGSTYRVDYEHGSCNCMHYVMRESRCRHMDAVDTAMGQVVNSESENVDVIEQRAVLDATEESTRNEIMPDIDQEDDEFFYLDHQRDFHGKLRNGLEVPYEYENVLNGNDVTFGIELEFVDGDADAIARELYNEGICAFPERVQYHARSVEGMWKLERDGSVSEGRGGGELVSPILKDTPQTWRTIERICEVAKRHGARINYQCGGHVHIGMEPLDTARQRWRRFFKIMSGYEECLYRAAGGDEGRIRSGYRHYATSFQARADYGINTRVQLSDAEDVSRLATDVSQRDRYYALNLSNIASSSRANTVEFRYFNGSLNPKQIQANIKLSAGIMMAARKARTKDIESIGYQVSESFKRRGNIINNYNETSNKTNKKIMEFLDVVFTRKQDKDALISVFSKNRWK